MFTDIFFDQTCFFALIPAYMSVTTRHQEGCWASGQAESDRSPGTIQILLDLQPTWEKCRAAERIGCWTYKNKMMKHSINSSVFCGRNRSAQTWFNNWFEGPGGFEELREAGRNHPAPISCQSSFMVSSFDQKSLPYKCLAWFQRFCKFLRML